MSRMSDLHLDIIEAIGSGEHPKEIASRLNVPLSWVRSVEDDFYSELAAQHNWAHDSADADALAYGEW